MPDAGGLSEKRASARASVSARLDRLPVTRTLRTLVILLSLGGFFEFYDIFFSGYIAPGLVRSHILTSTRRACSASPEPRALSPPPSRGSSSARRCSDSLQTASGAGSSSRSLLWYTAASVVMAFQNDAFGLDLWRFIAGIGVGVELVTIDAYISELVPTHWRGRAFAINQSIQFCAFR